MRSTESIQIFVILGSGLGGLADAVEEPDILDFHDIPGFPVSTGKRLAVLSPH